MGDSISKIDINKNSINPKDCFCTRWLSKAVTFLYSIPYKLFLIIKKIFCCTKPLFVEKKEAIQQSSKEKINNIVPIITNNKELGIKEKGITEPEKNTAQPNENKIVENGEIPKIVDITTEIENKSPRLNENKIIEKINNIQNIITDNDELEKKDKIIKESETNTTQLNENKIIENIVIPKIIDKNRNIEDITSKNKLKDSNSNDNETVNELTELYKKKIEQNNAEIELIKEIETNESLLNNIVNAFEETQKPLGKFILVKMKRLQNTLTKHHILIDAKKREIRTKISKLDQDLEIPKKEVENYEKNLSDEIKNRNSLNYDIKNKEDYRIKYQKEKAELRLEIEKESKKFNNELSDCEYSIQNNQTWGEKLEIKKNTLMSTWEEKWKLNWEKFEKDCQKPGGWEIKNEKQSFIDKQALEKEDVLKQINTDIPKDININNVHIEEYKHKAEEHQEKIKLNEEKLKQFDNEVKDALNEKQKVINDLKNDLQIQEEKVIKATLTLDEAKKILSRHNITILKQKNDLKSLEEKLNNERLSIIEKEEKLAQLKVAYYQSHQVATLDQVFEYLDHQEKLPLPTISHWKTDQLIALLMAISMNDKLSPLEKLCLQALGMGGSLKNGLTITVEHPASMKILKDKFVQERIIQLEIAHPKCFAECAKILKHCSQLTTLIFIGRCVTTAKELLECSKAIPEGIKTLKFESCRITGYILEPLKKLSNLTSLSLCHCEPAYEERPLDDRENDFEYTNTQMDEIKQMFWEIFASCNIEELDLSESRKIQPNNILENLEKYDQKKLGILRSLNFQGLDFVGNEKKLNPLLKKCSNLEFLNISGCFFKAIEPQIITQVLLDCKNLKKFDVDFFIDDFKENESKDFFKKYGKILSGLRLHWLKYNISKDELNILMDNEIEFTEMAKSTGNLSYLDLSAIKWNDTNGINLISGNRNTLEQLEFSLPENTFGFGLSWDSIEMISQCIQLKKLNLAYQNNHEYALNDEYLELILRKIGAHLTELDLQRNPGITSKGILNIEKYVKSLSSIDLSRARKVESGSLIKLIQKFGQSLKVLKLGIEYSEEESEQISEAIVKHCTNLEVLHLPYNANNNKILSDFFKFNSDTLRELAINDTAGTLELIKEHGKRLRLLKLINFKKLEKSVIEDFKKDLPLLQIEKWV